LRNGDPLLAARQFRALVEADMVERCLMGAHKVPPPAAVVSRAAENAVTTFFRAYAPGDDAEAPVAKPVPDAARIRKRGSSEP
jgi:hypothetical protein